jgi:hypothetical protein
MTSAPGTPSTRSPADLARGRKLLRLALVVYPLVGLGAVLLALSQAVGPWAVKAGIACLVLAVAVWLVFGLRMRGQARSGPARPGG